MEQSIKKFLEFNGTNVYFTSADGQYWIAIRPICTALKVHYEHQRENINSDKFLSQLPRHHRVVAADGKLRSMLCLPEEFIYGWIMQINSDSRDLMEFKWQCYQVLYHYFHGTLTNRTTILKVKTQAELEIEKAEEALRNTPEFQKVEALKVTVKQNAKALSRLDRDYVSSQLDLWKTEVAVIDPVQVSDTTTAK